MTANDLEDGEIEDEQPPKQPPKVNGTQKHEEEEELDHFQKWDDREVVRAWNATIGQFRKTMKSTLPDYENEQVKAPPPVKDMSELFPRWETVAKKRKVEEKPTPVPTVTPTTPSQPPASLASDPALAQLLWQWYQIGYQTGYYEATRGNDDTK